MGFGSYELKGVWIYNSRPVVLILRRSKINKPAIIVELKWNKTFSSAIEQIKNRQCIESLKGYSGEVVLVGGNYDDGGDREFKKHVCRIERIGV